MIEKNEIVCLKFLGKGPFFDEYIVSFIHADAKSPKLYLRAMKKSLIALSKTDESMVMIELAIRTSIRHPFLVNQIFAFQDYDTLYYIGEYAPVQMLRSNILPKKFSLEMARFYAAEIFLCLKYLHEKKQNYTFLTPQNVLLGIDGHIKLNYNFCNCIEYSMDSLLENIEYSSFDYLKNKRFSYLSDYWSLGVLFYEMLLGYTPFTESSLNQTIIEMRKGDLYLPESLDPAAKSFIMLLVDRELEKKYPACELLETAIESHPIFANIDLDKLQRKEYEAPFKFTHPAYNLSASPTLDVLYTTDFVTGDCKDGYGSIFANYSTINYLTNKKCFLKH